MEEAKIITNAAQREAFFIGLYQKAFPSVTKYVARRGGTLDDAKDIFQDAVVVLYENKVNGKDTPQNEQAYLMGIAKHLWLKKYNGDKGDELTENLANTLASEDEEIPSAHRLLNYLEKAGRKCLNLLKAFYYDRTPLEELAQEFGFSGTRSATVQKYKCLEKVRETVKQKQLQYEDFID